MKLEKLINDNYDKLNENDLHIWNYLLSHKEECKSLSIQGLATNAMYRIRPFIDLSKNLAWKAIAS